MSVFPRRASARISISLVPGVIYEWTPDGTTLVEPVVDAVELKAPRALSPLVPGAEIVAGYRLVACIGEGSTGEVWRATGPGGVAVALKFIEADQRSSTQELRSLTQMLPVRHANLVTIFGIWKRADWTVIGMDLADESLLDRFESAVHAGRSGLDFHELTDFLRQAARGIDFLNEPKHAWAGSEGEMVGLAHRDIKPQNLLLVGGSVKVGDFGLVKRLTADTDLSTEPGADGIESLLTAYTAPEIRRGSISARADQYSLAATYCHLRGGRVATTPFTASEPRGQPVSDAPSDVIDLSMLPRAERLVVARALATEPEIRWRTCTEFVEALVASGSRLIPPPMLVVAQATADSPSLRTRVRRAKRAALVALSITATVALVWSSKSPPAPVAIAARPALEVLDPAPTPQSEVRNESVVETTSIVPPPAPDPTPDTTSLPSLVDQMIVNPLDEVVAEVAPTLSGDEIRAFIQAWVGATQGQVKKRFVSVRASAQTWIKAIPRPSPSWVQKPAEPLGPKTVSIIVRMPNSKAELVVRGDVGRGNPDEWYGPRRVIHTPPITRAHEYLIGAFWTDPDGRQMTRSQALMVEPGRLYEIDLRAAIPTAVEVHHPPAP